MDDRDMSFARLLRELRRAHGLTQRELAERAGFSEIYVALLERGRRRAPGPTVQALADALGLDGRERAALRAAAGDEEASPPDGEGPAAPLVGRAAERELLRRHIAGETGTPLLLLAGEPGIGKTRLLDEAARLAAAQRLAVVRGGCQRLGGEEGYAPFPAALLDTLRAYAPAEQRALLRDCAPLAALLRELTQGPDAPLARPRADSAGGQERRLLFAAMARFLDRVAGPRGTLLVLDDLHWAGEDALALLTHLARSAAGGSGLRLIGAYRDTEVGPALGLALADLAHARLLARHTLGPLPRQEAAHLLDRLLAEDADAAAGEADGRAEVLRRAGGVPFYLVSWAQELRAGAGEAGALPWDVTQSIAQRVAVLPAEAQALLAVAAVIGRTIPVRLLAAASGLPAADVRKGLDALGRARLLEEESSPETGPAYRFTHDVVREVVENTIGAARRAELHGRVAAALEQLARKDGRPLPVETLAYHYARAGDADALAARYLEEAAEHARRQYAYAAAEEHYREALLLLDALGRPCDAARIRLRLGEMLRLTGRHHDEALSLLEAAAAAYRAAGDGAGAGRALAEIGYVHLARGAVDAGIRRLEEGAALLAPHGDARDAGSCQGLALLHLALAQLYTRAGQASEHLMAVERAAALAQEAGDGETLALAELGRGQALLAMGRHDEGVAALERGSRLARAAGGEAPAEALIYAAVMLLIAAAYDRCIAYVDRLLSDAGAGYDPSQRAFLLYTRGTAAFLQGRWPTAAADYEQAVALVRASGPSALAAYPVYGAGYLAVARGEETAPALLEEALRLAREADDPYTLWSAQAALAEADLLAGRPAAAAERLSALSADPASAGVGVAQGTLILTAWARLALGDAHGAAEAADEGIARARAEGTPAGLVDTLWVRARAAIALGDADTAETMLSGALSLARGIGYRRGEARVLWAQGELALARGNAAGRTRLAEALDIFQGLGARPEAALVAQLLASRR